MSTAIQSCMKKQIITLVSILAFSTLTFAKPCTTENVGNSSGQNMQTTWVSGQGSSYVVIAVNYTFGKITGTISQNGHVVSILGIKNGKFIYDDLKDGYGTWEISCQMNQQNNIMVTDGSVQFVLRSSFAIGNNKKSTPAATVSAKQARINKDLGDWAPVEPKLQAAPPKVVQSNTAKSKSWVQ